MTALVVPYCVVWNLRKTSGELKAELAQRNRYVRELEKQLGMAPGDRREERA